MRNQIIFSIYVLFFVSSFVGQEDNNLVLNSSFESSYEDGLLDGRKELAENLLEQIKKWEAEHPNYLKDEN